MIKFKLAICAAFALFAAAAWAFSPTAPNTNGNMKLGQIKTDTVVTYPFVKLPNGAQFVEKPELNLTSLDGIKF